VFPRQDAKLDARQRAGSTESPYDQEVERMKKFLSWTKATKGLGRSALNDHAAIAVAQALWLCHSFRRLTNEPLVAGYFASEGAAEAKALDLEAEKKAVFSGASPPRRPWGAFCASTATGSYRSS
jgi:hypothetical protein